MKVFVIFHFVLAVQYYDRQQPCCNYYINICTGHMENLSQILKSAGHNTCEGKSYNFWGMWSRKEERKNDTEQKRLGQSFDSYLVAFGIRRMFVPQVFCIVNNNVQKTKVAAGRSLIGRSWIFLGSFCLKNLIYLPLWVRTMKIVVSVYPDICQNISFPSM